MQSKKFEEYAKSLESTINSKKEFMLGLIIGLILGILGNLWVAGLWNIIDTEPSTVSEIIIFIVTTITIAFLVYRWIKNYQKIRTIENDWYTKDKVALQKLCEFMEAVTKKK